MNKKAKSILGWSGIIVIALIPVLLLFILGPKGFAFSNYSKITQALGEITGLVGITLFALTFVLSTRMKWIEEVFGGLDKVYIVHGILGGTALVLILLHPIFIVLKFIPSAFPLAASYFIPGSVLSLDLGIIALIGMIALLFITLFTKVRYHRWKFTHEFLGLIFIFAVLHSFLVRGTVSMNYIFRGYDIYMGIVAAVGITAFIYSLFVKSHPSGNTPYEISKITKRGEAYEIEMVPKNDPLKYKAGQFIFVRFYNDKLSKEAHPFSVASESDSGNLRIVVKALGDFTENLKHLKVKDKVSVEGPYGKFNFKNKENKNQIWIAGGIGITPFLGMAKELGKNRDYKVDLYHTVKDKSGFMDYEFLSGLSSGSDNFRFFPWNYEDKKRFINIKDISETSSGLKDKDFFICGPDAFKDDLTSQLIKEGIKKSHIHKEDFSFK